MSLYRVKQFLWSIFSRINEDDLRFIDAYLDQEKVELFKKLSVSEQKHSIRVARRVKDEYDSFIKESGTEVKECYRRNLIAIALLHDIGKIHKRINVIDKSVLVILNKLTKGKLKSFTNIQKVDVYYNHAEKGAKILKDYGLDERALFLVRNHHNNDMIIDRELELLKYCDSVS